MQTIIRRGCGTCSPGRVGIPAPSVALALPGAAYAAVAPSATLYAASNGTTIRRAETAVRRGRFVPRPTYGDLRSAPDRSRQGGGAVAQRRDRRSVVGPLPAIASKPSERAPAPQINNEYPSRLLPVSLHNLGTYLIFGQNLYDLTVAGRSQSGSIARAAGRLFERASRPP
jgi:hypothetical protein